MKIDNTVKKETKRILIAVVLLSLIMELIFFAFGRWDYTVLLGNLVSGTVTVLNFFLMGLTVQKAVLKGEKEARRLIQLSQMGRTFAILVIVAVCVLLPYFNVWSSIIPLFFTRISMIGRGR